MSFEQIIHSWWNDVQRQKIIIVISSKHLSSRAKFYAPVDICNGPRIKIVLFTCRKPFDLSYESSNDRNVNALISSSRSLWGF